MSHNVLLEQLIEMKAWCALKLSSGSSIQETHCDSQASCETACCTDTRQTNNTRIMKRKQCQRCGKFQAGADQSIYAEETVSSC